MKFYEYGTGVLSMVCRLSDIVPDFHLICCCYNVFKKYVNAVIFFVEIFWLEIYQNVSL